MAQFRYTVLDPKGRHRSGNVEAANLEVARKTIINSGNLLVDLKPVGGRDWLRFERGHDLSLVQASAFATELAGLLNAGAPLRKALAISADGTASTSALAGSCLQTLDQGKSLSQALRTYKGGGEILAEFAKAGEAGAGLGPLLDSGGRFLRARVEAVSRIRKALAYPIFICLLAIVALCVITFYVAPSLAPILSEAGGGSFILWLASVGEWGRTNAQMISLFGIVLILSVVGLLRHPKAKLALNSILWRLPFLGQAARDLDAGQSCDVMAALLERGRPLDTSLSFAASVAGPKLANVYLSIADKLRDGAVASDAFASERDLPQDVRRLIVLGERSSAFVHAIKQAGAICHTRALKRIDQVAAVLGPALVIGLGVLTSLLMLSVLNSLGSLGDIS